MRGILCSELPWFVRYGAWIVILAVVVGFTAAMFMDCPVVAEAVCVAEEDGRARLYVGGGVEYHSGDEAMILLPGNRGKIPCRVETEERDASGLLLTVEADGGLSGKELAGRQVRIVVSRPLYEKLFLAVN